MTKIEKYLRGHPDANPKFVADKFSMSISYVYVLKSKIKKERIADGLIKSSPKKEKLIMTYDNVNHPSHYKMGGIETIDFIEAKSLNYNLGNVVKYITRADYKGNKIEDLKKAQWYLNREVSNLEKSK
jgi:hypothetical protein